MACIDNNNDSDHLNNLSTEHDSRNDPSLLGTISTPTSTGEFPSLQEVQFPELSYREREVLQYLAIGYSPEQIALRLSIKTRTVRKHLNNLRNKFDSESRDQLMARAGYLGLCNPYK